MNLDIINNNEDFFTPDNKHFFNIEHREIINKLEYFVNTNQIPNIIFYGNNSSGKKYILKYFLKLIYKKNNNIEDNILSINCCHGKGNIKFIREELKLFSNSVIVNNSYSNIKSVILLNADSLTIDAQSSLRRLIEVNNKTTRFFIVVNNYEKLLKPIISRFCSIYFNFPTIKGKYTTYNNILYNDFSNVNNSTLKRILTNNKISVDNTNLYNNIEIIEMSELLYSKGYSSLDIINYIESIKYNNRDKYKIINLFDHLVKEFRNEKIIIYFLLNFIFFRFNYDIKKFL